MNKKIILLSLFSLVISSSIFASPFDENEKIESSVIIKNISDSTGTSKLSTKILTSNKSCEKKEISNEKEKSSKKELGSLVDEDKVKVTKLLSKFIGWNYNEKGYKYTNVQGFCTDGKYWYIAVMTSQNGDNTYKDQETKLLKIEISTKKLVASKKVGKIGHSNSLTYNDKTKKIYSCTCTNIMSYCYEFNSSDLSGKKKIYFKDKKGNEYKDKGFASFAYDSKKDQYIVKFSNEKLGIFDSDFKQIDAIKVDKYLKIDEKMTGQAISCDGKNIFSVCNNLNFPTVNYILCYDMNGKFVKQYTFKNELASKVMCPEMEQIACYDGKYWSLTNYGRGRLRIHSISLRN